MKYNKEKLKQILLTCIAFSLIMVGYLNYNLDKKEQENVEVSAETNDVNLGDVQLVNSKPQEDIGMIVSNDEMNFQVAEDNENSNEINKSDNENIIEESSNVDNYFEETKIERDRMYSEMLETYQKLINNEQTPTDQKAIAAQEISNITNQKNGIMISENLIKNKGFENVVILINNETVSVVVKSSNLNQEQISKIQNIVQRELKVEISNINISNKH